MLFRSIARWKELADYAHSKKILLGGYSLFSSRRISDEDDVVDPKTGKPGGAFFGHAPCFGSKWGLAYRNKIKHFFAKTGFDIWENDGPYPGDVCGSTVHPGHKGLDDSQWRQMEIQKELYRWLNERGVYINAPDWYFLDGTHKIAIGYREVNFSLSREQQRILNRQNIHDGTMEKTGAMSWGFVPLTRYQGGGPEAVLEKLVHAVESPRPRMPRNSDSPSWSGRPRSRLGRSRPPCFCRIMSWRGFFDCGTGVAIWNVFSWGVSSAMT